MIAHLFAGMFIGSIIASVAWVLILKTEKNKSENERNISGRTNAYTWRTLG